jgi:hypothetical protein
MFNCTVPGASVAISAATHGGCHQLSSQSPSPVFLCLKSGYLSFVYNQKSQSSWSAMHSSHPRQECYHKDRESHTDLVHQHIASTYLLQPTTTILPAQMDMKELLPTIRPWQDNNQERAARLTSTTHVNSEDWSSVTFSDLWSHHCEGSKKNSCHSFFLWPTGTAEKHVFKSCSLITYKPHWGSASCTEGVQFFDFLLMIFWSKSLGKQTNHTAVRRKQHTHTHTHTDCTPILNIQRFFLQFPYSDALQSSSHSLMHFHWLSHSTTSTF